MEKRISWCLTGVFLVAVFCWIGCVSAAEGPVTLKVYDPTGAIEVTQLHARRLDDLNGRTICELSNGSWEDNRTFPVIRELLQRQFSTAKIVPYTEFPVGNVQIDVDTTADLVKKKGCQAAIVGNAG
jgi:hypothetical protein